MPNDISSIKRKTKSPIKNPTWLSEKIEAYFKLISGDEDMSGLATQHLFPLLKTNSILQ